MKVLKEYLEKALKGVPVQEAKKDASKEYMMRKKEMNSVMNRLHSLIKTHEMEFKKQPTNWAMVGDMGRLLNDLKDIMEYMES